MDTQTLTIMVSVVALAIAAYAIYRSHQAGIPLTGELIQSSLEDAQPRATELTEAALTGARASEQQSAVMIVNAIAANLPSKKAGNP